jgi:MFS family permease
MTLALAEPERRGYRLGQVHAAGAVGAAGGLLVAQALALTGAEVRWLFLPAGATGLLAAGFCLGIPRDIKTPGPRLVVRRSYRLYYLLSFLEGWRKQIFVAFAGFLLVERHGVPLTTMLWLWIATNAIRWVVSPMIGRWIDRIGERPVLTFYFASLTVFFAGYALIDHVPTLMVIFVIDNAYFAFAAALTSYVGKVAPPEDHTPTLSMGVACNHVAAVSMPLVGGVLWHVAGYQWAFVLGAAAAAGSILAVRRLPDGPAAGQADRNSPADSADMKVTTDEGREI